MPTDIKRFDCVEMKRRAQEKLQAEFAQRRAEFASYVDFLNAKAKESEMARIFRAKKQGSAAQ
jgi:hypothetical protein